ncbi:SdpI family protein [Candidatus Woesearchaeota archaeon]|nr:SdpI family protein [Candidatus Woesearchaeota archaeon]
MKKIDQIIIALLFIFSISVFLILPEKIVTHWDENSIPNGTMNKTLGVFLTPLITLFIYALLIFIPRIDPLKKNFKDFQKEYSLFTTVFLLFMTYMQVITMLWNLNIKIPIFLATIPALSILFITIGTTFENIKPNWFIGIRTPWTLSNENVWKKTHKEGSKVFKIMGILLLATIAVPKLAFYMLIIIILTGVIYLTVYSYIQYKKK